MEAEQINGGLDKWISPREAITRLLPLLQKDDRCRNTLIERLCAGLIRSKCSTARFKSPVGKNFTTHSDYSVAATFWEQFRNKGCRGTENWDTGDFTALYFHRDGTAEVRLYSVELDLAGVDQILPKALHSKSFPSTSSTEPNIINNEAYVDIQQVSLSLPIAAVGAPPVSATQLERWYEFFKTTYPVALQNEFNAWNHARYSFPKNTVSRQAVRRLRGKQKTGPKSAAELDISPQIFPEKVVC